MTFDQAQSPRLGQRTPVESTYVRIFTGPTLPEAAWRGQMIYREDTQELLIYNGTAWEEVVGGQLDQLTFVGPSVPTAGSVGDQWFDTANSYRLYVARSAGADEIKPGEWELAQDSQAAYDKAVEVEGVALTAADKADFAEQQAALAENAALQAEQRADLAKDAADAADLKAELAQSAADVAAGIAQTRTRVWIQATPPVATAVNEIWYDTSAGYKQYRSESVGADSIGAGEWTSVQDAAISFTFTTLQQATSSRHYIF